MHGALAHAICLAHGQHLSACSAIEIRAAKRDVQHMKFNQGNDKNLQTHNIYELENEIFRVLLETLYNSPKRNS
jgi:hypothetical protein